MSTNLGTWKVGGRGVTDLEEQRKAKYKCLQSWGTLTGSKEIRSECPKEGGVKGWG